MCLYSGTYETAAFGWPSASEGAELADEGARAGRGARPEQREQGSERPRAGGFRPAAQDGA